MLNSYLALDVGRVRIGVAVANSVARIAAPLPALAHDDTILTQLKALIVEHEISQLVVGLPRGLNGQQTEQTDYVENFVEQLEQELSVPVALQDEATTSLKAEAELKQRGKPFEKGDIDSLSAVYILEDYLAEGVH